jgi:hypothetical protein
MLLETIHFACKGYSSSMVLGFGLSCRVTIECVFNFVLANREGTTFPLTFAGLCQLLTDPASSFSDRPTITSPASAPYREYLYMRRHWETYQSILKVSIVEALEHNVANIK